MNSFMSCTASLNFFVQVERSCLGHQSPFNTKCHKAALTRIRKKLVLHSQMINKTASLTLYMHTRFVFIPDIYGIACKQSVFGGGGVK